MLCNNVIKNLLLLQAGRILFRVVGNWQSRIKSLEVCIRPKNFHYIITLGQKPSFPALCNRKFLLHYFITLDAFITLQARSPARSLYLLSEHGLRGVCRADKKRGSLSAPPLVPIGLGVSHLQRCRAGWQPRRQSCAHRIARHCLVPLHPWPPLR